MKKIFTLNKSSKISAFTLAEVLITLVIIGVVAALTVPNMITKTKNQEYVSKLKKTYSTMTQATNHIIANEGPVEVWSNSGLGNYNLYKKYLLKAIECEGSNGCFLQEKMYYLNGGSDPWNSRSDLKKLVLNDGTHIVFSTNMFSEDCNMSSPMNTGSNNVCQVIYIDLNGAKKPNTMGKDMYTFVLKKDGIHLAGCDIDGLCNKNQNGCACACKVIKEEKIDF